MRLRILGCAGGSAPGGRLSSYLVDDRIAVDAGALTTALSLDLQREVEGVLLTHGHLDHVWSLPLFLANRFGGATSTCQIHASAYTLETIQTHLFNGRIWPDFTSAKVEERDLVSFHAFEPGTTQTLAGGYEVTSVALDHTVPCQAYLIRRGHHSLLICGDTTTTDAVWELANATDDLRGVLIECSFENDLVDLAHASGHLTPELLLADLKKLRRDVEIHVMHLKPGYESAIRNQLAGTDDRIRFCAQDDVIDAS